MNALQITKMTLGNILEILQKKIQTILIHKREHIFWSLVYKSKDTYSLLRPGVEQKRGRLVNLLPSQNFCDDSYSFLCPKMRERERDW